MTEIPSLYDFTRDNWHRICQQPFSEDRGTYRLCGRIEKALAKPNGYGHHIGRACGKTLVGTVLLPVWVWMQGPAKRIIVVQHHEAIRQKHSKIFIGLCGELGVPIQVNERKNIENPRGGYRLTCSPFQFLGHRADIIVLDDAFLALSPGSSTHWQQVEEARNHWPTKLTPDGTMIELES